MALRLSDSRSSSSPEPASGMRRDRSPDMILRLASLTVSMRVSTLRLISSPAPMPSSDSSPTLHSATCHMVSANWR